MSWEVHLLVQNADDADFGLREHPIEDYVFAIIIFYLDKCKKKSYKMQILLGQNEAKNQLNQADTTEVTRRK